MTRHVTVREAAQFYHVTPKTIHRRIERGELVASRKGRAYVVEIPADATVDAQEGTGRRDDDASATRLAAADAALRQVTSERDYLRQKLDEMIRQNASLTATVYQLTQRPALPAPRAGLWARIRNWWRRVSEGESGE